MVSAAVMPEVTQRPRVSPGRVRNVFVLGFVLVVLVVAPMRLLAQATDANWQAEVRKDAEARHWDDALRIVDQQVARSPKDMDILAWRARVLAWAGRLPEAQATFETVLKAEPGDPDNWVGLGNVYLREDRLPQALDAMDQAVKLDPRRPDLHAARARVLFAMGQLQEARLAAKNALDLDPANGEARAELNSLRGNPRQQLRFGMDSDLFNFTSANRGQWVSLVSRWTPHWTTNVAGNFYQIAGLNAGKFVGSFTASTPRWGAMTLGGASGHDSGVIPENEAFFEGDHGWKISETGFVRGLEVTYGQHWYWYSSATILTLNQNSIVYLPHDWIWSLGASGIRNQFIGTGLDWKPAGRSKLEFPIHSWGAHSLSGNVFFAVGTEDFARVNEIGSFSSHTAGGGFHFQINSRQDVTGYAGYQQRERGFTDTAFGWSYGVRF